MVNFRLSTSRSNVEFAKIKEPSPAVNMEGEGSVGYLFAKFDTFEVFS